MWNQITKSRIKKIEKLIKPIYQNNKVKFHTYTHINDGLNLMYQLPDHMKPNDNQLIAWLFHDIVYDVSSKTNEEDSAKYFQTFYNNNTELFKEFDINSKEVSNIILDTKAHKEEHSTDSGLVLDIDMSCLAGDFDHFLKGRFNVLKEYALIYDNEALLKGTFDFINAFENKPIFVSDFFIENYEKSAQRNLAEYRKYLYKNKIEDMIRI